MLLMSLIHSIDKEGTDDRMSSLKITFTLDPLKTTRTIAEHFVANFPLHLTTKNVELMTKTTKQK